MFTWSAKITVIAGLSLLTACGGTQKVYFAQSGNQWSEITKSEFDQRVQNGAQIAPAYAYGVSRATTNLTTAPTADDLASQSRCTQPAGPQHPAAMPCTF
ncbi:hypothetical protein [Pseudoprimorskyibacter insulae]|uniref:Lipoprotein n=1 Tax=Pseudoprimorskyibacter insulae TaxID=1695997 RepID=A0A2R8APM6_9RHOB|nr:hypothetical protein [Pseudoprimorskyibacter insulae]SPF77819.1 hypothetical protein PRI8871_00405 [Pseudoprimorskyibacter insulae]